MHKLTAFQPFFGMYLRTPAKRSSVRGSSISSRFASFTERERTYLAPKRMLSTLRRASAPARLSNAA